MIFRVAFFGNLSSDENLTNLSRWKIIETSECTKHLHDVGERPPAQKKGAETQCYISESYFWYTVMRKTSLQAGLTSLENQCQSISAEIRRNIETYQESAKSVGANSYLGPFDIRLAILDNFPLV